MAEVEYGVSKAVYHADKIKQLQEGKQIIPLGIQIDLEAYCNDNCEFCSYRKDNGHNNMMLNLIGAVPGEKYEDNKPIGKPSPMSRIPLEFAETLPRQLKEAGIRACELTGGGEPTLWPAFDQLYENLGLNGIEIGLITNGSTMSDKRAALVRKYGLWCRISMDAATQETHKKLHRTANEDFERRLNNIRKLTTDKPETLTVGISYIINQDNYKEIREAAKLYKELGVDHLRFSWMYDMEGNAGLTDEEKEWCKKTIRDCQEKYQTDNYLIFTEYDRIDLYSKPNDDFKKCYYQHFVLAIGADGGVYPCCIQKYYPEYQYANIKEKTLKQIVTDINTKTFMDNLNPAGCNPCWLRNRNKSMAAAIEKPKHHNFI